MVPELERSSCHRRRHGGDHSVGMSRTRKNERFATVKCFVGSLVQRTVQYTDSILVLAKKKRQARCQRFIFKNQNKLVVEDRGPTTIQSMLAIVARLM